MCLCVSRHCNTFEALVSHVEATIGIYSHATMTVSEQLILKPESLATFPFPKEIHTRMEDMGKKYGYDTLIQRVSNHSFAVRALERSFQAPV